MALSSHLYLTGYRGTGKTSVARLLADRLEVSAIDLDAMVEQTAGITIHEIFEQSGESGFRDLESSSLVTVSQMPPAVVSLGGGAVLRRENRERIAATGTCVWLDAEVETIAQRLGTDETTPLRRPALTSMDALEEIRHLLDERRPVYEEASQHRIDTTHRTVDQVADDVLALLS